MSQPAESLDFYRYRYAYCADERGKAMQRGDKVAEMIYQVLMIEYDAQIERYREVTRADCC